jgi:hypothetical protein
MRNYELRDSIIDVSQKLGIDPIDLATAISYETAGTFDPWKAGPTTQWGQHRGLIQWGKDQRDHYHVTKDSTIPEQMDAVGQYLTDAGVQPGMGLRDIYSAINAGHVGRYNASDAHNGGDRGTVDDKVNRMQTDGHLTKALRLIEPGVTDGPKGQESYALPFAGAQVSVPIPTPRPAQPQDALGLANQPGLTGLPGSGSTVLPDARQSTSNQQVHPMLTNPLENHQGNGARTVPADHRGLLELIMPKQQQTPYIPMHSGQPNTTLKDFLEDPSSTVRPTVLKDEAAHSILGQGLGSKQRNDLVQALMMSDQGKATSALVNPLLKAIMLGIPSGQPSAGNPGN